MWILNIANSFFKNKNKRPRREYYTTEGATNSPPEPEDDYVAEELPSMAMDHTSIRKDDEDEEREPRDDRDDVFAAPPEKQRRMDETNRWVKWTS